MHKIILAVLVGSMAFSSASSAGCIWESCGGTKKYEKNNFQADNKSRKACIWDVCGGNREYKKDDPTWEFDRILEEKRKQELRNLRKQNRKNDSETGDIIRCYKISNGHECTIKDRRTGKITHRDTYIFNW